MPSKSFGTPTITGTTVDELKQSIQFWIQHAFNFLDQQAGLRGTPSFFGRVDAHNNRISNVGDPTVEGDAATKGTALIKKRNADGTEQWDAETIRIVDLTAGKSPLDGVNLTQLNQAIADALESVRNEPFVTAIASANLNAERVLTAQLTVTTITDNGANSTIVVGVAANGITDTQLRQGIAVSVIGRSANSLGNVADIAAAANGNILRRAANVLGFGQIDLADGTNAVSGILDEPNGGTGNSSYTIGDVLYASAATVLSKLADVAAGSYLRSGGVGVAPLWSTPTLPNSAVTGDVLYASAANVYSNLADVAVGSYLRSGGVGVAPLWSTPTLPNSATTGDLLYASAANIYSNLADVAAGSYLRSGGVGVAPLWSTPTLPNSATTGDVLYASAANVYSNLADVATGQVLTSGGVGVAPTWSATPTVTSISFGADPLNTYAEVAFTVTGTGFTVNPTGTARYVSIGKIVVLFIPALSGTSNATTFTLTGMPVAVQPTQTASFAIRIADNGVDAFGLAVMIAGSTTIDLYPVAGATGWTNSGTKIFYATMLTYNRM